MTRRVGKVSAAVVAAVLFWGSPAQASHGNGKHWSGSGVRTVKVVDKTGDSRWQQYVGNAVRTWNNGNSNGNVGVRLVHEKSSAKGGCSIDRGVIEVCLGDASFTKWKYNSAAHFLGVAVTLSPSMLRKAGDAIACHELGHAVGLGHRQDNTSSCMRATVTPQQTRPTDHDYKTVIAQHNH